LVGAKSQRISPPREPEVQKIERERGWDKTEKRKKADVVLRVEKAEGIPKKKAGA